MKNGELLQKYINFLENLHKKSIKATDYTYILNNITYKYIIKYKNNEYYFSAARYELEKIYTPEIKYYFRCKISIKKNIYIRFIINYNKTYKIDLIKYECSCPLNIKTINFYNDNDKKSIKTFYYVKKFIRTFIYLKIIFYYFNYYKFSKIYLYYYIKNSNLIYIKYNSRNISNYIKIINNSKLLSIHYILYFDKKNILLNIYIFLLKYKIF